MKNIFCVEERHSNKCLSPHNVVFGYKTERFLIDVNSAHCKFIRMRLKCYLKIYFSTNQFLIFYRLHYFLHLYEDKGEIATLLKYAPFCLLIDAAYVTKTKDLTKQEF